MDAPVGETARGAARSAAADARLRGDQPACCSVSETARGGHAARRLRRGSISWCVPRAARCSSYHSRACFRLDVPPGNIPLGAVATLRQHPLGRAAACRSGLGDTLRGHRVCVGTTPAVHRRCYAARLAAGPRMAQAARGGARQRGARSAPPASTRQATASSARTGWAPAAADVHGDTPYAVAGVYERTGRQWCLAARAARFWDPNRCGRCMGRTGHRDECRGH